MKPAISQCCGNRRAEDQLSLREIGGAKDHSEDDRFELVDTSSHLLSCRSARELRGVFTLGRKLMTGQKWLRTNIIIFLGDS